MDINFYIQSIQHGCQKPKVNISPQFIKKTAKNGVGNHVTRFITFLLVRHPKKSHKNSRHVAKWRSQPRHKIDNITIGSGILNHPPQKNWNFICNITTT
jgi:hypothetical protein